MSEETPAPATPAPVETPKKELSAAEMLALLNDVEQLGKSLIKKIEDLGPGITKEQLESIAAADPAKAKEILDGHLAEGEKQAELAKKEVMDKIKTIITIGGTIAAAGAGGPAGAAAASAGLGLLGGALDKSTEQ